MTSLKKVAGINLATLVAYSILSNVGSTGNERQMQVMVMMAFFICIQFGINLLVSVIYFIKGNRVVGRNFLLSSLVILVIGFSACWGLSTI